jgi:CBS-domain-containing membrane protein
MIWERLRHIPVEDHEHRLVGVVTHRAVMRFIMSGGAARRTAIADIMKRDVFSVKPETPTLEALRTMRRLRIGCLPVTHEDRLVGIVTEEDFMDLASKLLEEQIGAAEQLSLGFPSEAVKQVAAVAAEAKTETKVEAKAEPVKADAAAPASETTPRTS